MSPIVIEHASDKPAPAAIAAEPVRDSHRALFWGAALIAALLSAGLNLLMARIIWLPLYSGLFGFLVQGLLVGGLAFRIARRARPVPATRRIAAVVLLSLWSGATMLYHEYRYTRSTIAEPPLFHAARNDALDRGESPAEVSRAAARAFDAELKRTYPPGGAFGYARWCIAAGTMPLDVRGYREVSSTPHKGLPWLARTLGGMALIAAGLWFSLDALRTDRAVSNVIQPGEEFEEID